VAFRGPVWHVRGMVWFHRLGIVLLVLALLPWGAYSGARVAPLAAAVVAAAGGDAGLGSDVPRAGVAVVAHHCRTGLLTGGCETKAVVDRVLAVAAGGRTVVLRPGEAVRGEGRMPSAPRDPPRRALA